MSTLTLELISESSANYNDTQFIELALVNHVHKRIEHFEYLSEIRSDSVPLDYIEYTKTDAKSTLLLLDRSYTLAGLSNQVVQQLNTSFRGNSFISAYSKILATHKTYINEYNQVKPLYFKHILPEDTKEAYIEASGTLEPLATGYSIDYENQCIYTNLSNRVEANEYLLYIVTSIDSTGKQTKSLLNPIPVATEATWKDIDPDTGLLYTGRPVYTKELGTVGYTYTFNMHTTWYIRIHEHALAGIQLPAGPEKQDPWYLRFNEIDYTINGKRYWMPEYYTQPFQPFAPYIFSNYQTVEYISGTCFRIPGRKLYIDPQQNMHLEIYVYDYLNVLIKVLTTDTSLHGKRYSDTDIFYESDIILSWDEQTGIFITAQTLHPTWSLAARFFYEATSLEYTGLNLNPVFNTNIFNYLVVFYLVPDAHSNDRALHYLLVDKQGIIVYTSQSQGVNVPNLQAKNNDGSSNPNSILGIKYISDLEVQSFYNLYTVNYTNTYKYVVLSEVTVRETTQEKPFQVSVKREGFTLKDPAAAFKKQFRLPTSRFGYAEDGMQFPHNVAILEVPLSLLEAYGGSFTAEQIETLSKKYILTGTQVILQWTFPWSELEIDTTISNQATLSFSWEGPDYEYRIYKRYGTETWFLQHTLTAPIEVALSYIDTDFISYDVTYELRLALNGIEYPAKYNIGVKIRS